MSLVVNLVLLGHNNHLKMYALSWSNTVVPILKLENLIGTVHKVDQQSQTTQLSRLKLIRGAGF